MMLRNFIQDKEIDLTKQRDLLGTKCYAQELVDVICNIPDGKVCTIGMYAGWGAGKSSIVSTTKSMLEGHDDKNIKVVVYDAWKYVNDSFRRMFLLHLQRELGLKGTPEMERFYKNVTEEVEPKITIRSKGMWITIAVLAFIWVGVGFLEATGVLMNSMTWAALISFASLVIALFNGVFYDLKITQTKNVLFAPEQFESCFKQMMGAVLKKNSGFLKQYHRLVDFVDKDGHSVHDLDKLVIVIDNIDRCSNEIAYSLLTDIKTFLSNDDFDVIFIVPVDDVALKKHFLSKNSDMESRDVEEFLRKFFNIVVHIREHRHEEILHYVHALNEEYQLNLNGNTLSLIAKEYAKNPRRIVQIINNFTVEQSLYDEAFARENETLIAALLIIREEYPLMISEILKNRTVIAIDFMHRKDDNGMLRPELNNNYEFLSFMRMARQTFIDADPDAIMRIITNTHQALNNLTEELVNAITSFDSGTVLTYIKSGAETRADILAYMCSRMKEDDDFDAENDILNYIELVAKLHTDIRFTDTELHELDVRMDRSYAFVCSSPADVTQIVHLAYDLDQINLSELKDSIFGYITDHGKWSEKKHSIYVDEVLRVFNDEYNSKRLNAFADEYFSTKPQLLDRKWSSEQLRFLFGDKLVQNFVDSITGFSGFNGRDNIIWCFNNLSGLTSNAYDAVLVKVTTLWGTSDRKSEKAFTELLLFLNPLLKSVQIDLIPQKALANLASILFVNRVLPNVSGSVRRQSIVSTNSKELSDLLVVFCFEVFRLMGEISKVNKYVLNLMHTSEQSIKRNLLSLQEKGLDITCFTTCISNMTHPDPDLFRLIPVLFRKNVEGVYLFSMSELTAKINLLLSFLSCEEAVDALIQIVEDDDIKDLIIKQMVLTDYDYLNRLPLKVLNLVLSGYNEDSMASFEMNNAYLRIILQKGTEEQKNLVKKTLLKRYIADQDRPGVLDLVEYCHFTKSECSQYDVLINKDSANE